MIRLMLFDIDGTLIRTGGAGVRAFAEVFEKHFAASEGFEKLKFAGRTDKGIVREFFKAHSIPPTMQNFDLFFSEYDAVLERIMEGTNVVVCPGVREYIAHARSLPDPPVIGLLTGNIRRGAEIKLRRVGLWDEFVLGGFADDHEERGLIAAAAKQRGEDYLNSRLADHEVLVIGDTPLDIACARAIRARVLAVGTGGATMEELRAHAPDYLVEDLTQHDPAWLLQ